jgi:adenine-specific DNA glycosylase
VEVAPGSGAKAALRTRLPRLVGAPVEVGRRLARIERTLTHRRLSIAAYRCRIRGSPRAVGHAELRWLRPAEMRDLGMATAMRRVLEAVRPGERAEERVGP